METTTLAVEQIRDRRTAERVRHLLDGEPGVAGVVVAEDRGEVYVKHNPEATTYQRLLERLEGEGFHARVVAP